MEAVRVTARVDTRAAKERASLVLERAESGRAYLLGDQYVIGCARDVLALAARLEAAETELGETREALHRCRADMHAKVIALQRRLAANERRAALAAGRGERTPTYAEEQLAEIERREAAGRGEHG